MARVMRFGLLALLVLFVAGCTQFDRVRDHDDDEVAEIPRFTIVTVTVAFTPTPRSAEDHYIVQDGDTLSGIAEMFGVSWDAIIQENNLQSQDAIFIGQELRIPVPLPETPEPTETS